MRGVHRRALTKTDLAIETEALTDLLVGGSFVFGVAAMVMAARAVGTKFDYGTMQGVLTALVLAAVAMIAAGWRVGSIVNIDTSAFFTADSLRAYGADVLRTAIGIVGLGLMDPAEATLSLGSSMLRSGLWVAAAGGLGLLVFQRRETSG